ncbi:PadR family transcriptional regulator [Actinokineospora sp. HUAS TT18]|uniref:PadR family transcriptional regulator n=1 Tax=Actinokineospora sp. HUAS TT18 TaxID=3447451 RepID=UPI003F51E049
MRTSFGPRRHGRRHHHVERHDFDMDFAPEADMTPPFPPMPPFPPGFGGRRHGHRGPGGRQRRGDVRAALLTLLVDRPMHGYEMIQEIAERSGGFWKPSPGSVYPTLQLLADEGLVRATDGDGGKRLFELTDDGRTAVANLGGTAPWDHAAAGVDPSEVNLRGAMGQLAAAIMGVSQAASPAQKAKAVEIINEARRQLYAVLGSADEE